MLFDNNGMDSPISSTVSEFTTPSEVLAVVAYLAKYYLIGATCTLVDGTIKLTYQQREQEAYCTIAPLSGKWTETLPDERLVLSGVVCEVKDTPPYAYINQLNSENADIKLFIDTKTNHVIIERVFSMIGGTTINNLIESILEFTANQSLLRKALS